MDDLSAIGKIASSGMRAQSQRMRITAENMANANSTGATPGAEPFRRKVIGFETMVDGATGANIVGISAVTEDPSDFVRAYDPANPAADEAGYYLKPNVDPLIELANMREASHSFEASLNMLDSGRRMRAQLIGMLEQ